MKTRFLGAAAALALMTSASANAAIILTSVETESVTSTSTNFFDAPMVFDKFDSSLGTLTRIFLTLEGTVQGTAKYESLDSSPTTVTLNLQATMDLTRPGGASIVQVLPVANVVDNPTSFDGVNDFGGTSGAEFTGLTNTANSNQVLSGAADLNVFRSTAAYMLPEIRTRAMAIRPHSS